ncbi:MAG: flagellar motor protein MotB [Bryobacteraceae bacterium]|jgi:chemotaxis protein MotB
MKVPTPSHGGSRERWLVSYADFVTLLFAFFVVLYAHSTTDQKQAHLIAASFRAAIGDRHVQEELLRLIGTGGALPPAPAAAQGPLKTAAPKETTAQGPNGVELLPSMVQLNKSLEKEIKEGRLEIRLERRGMIISLLESSFFPSGDKTILPNAKSTLERIAGNLKPLPNPIRLEGHTDAVPIHNTRFRSNWELSAARSIALMEMFTDDFALPRDRMSIAGFADTAPVASNETPEGRARNRRVDIVVLTVEGALGEPAHFPVKH